MVQYIHWKEGGAAHIAAIRSPTTYLPLCILRILMPITFIPSLNWKTQPFYIPLLWNTSERCKFTPCIVYIHLPMNTHHKGCWNSEIKSAEIRNKKKLVLGETASKQLNMHHKVSVINHKCLNSREEATQYSTSATDNHSLVSSLPSLAHFSDK